MNRTSPTEQLVSAFQSCTLPKAAWTHEAHLRVGLWHVLHLPWEEALARLRRGIRALNDSHGTANTDSAGYHETITRFYVHWIERFVTRAGRARPLDELADELVRAAGDSKLPLRYYSSQRLFSSMARRQWIEPDLLSLETAGSS